LASVANSVLNGSFVTSTAFALSVKVFGTQKVLSSELVLVKAHFKEPAVVQVSNIPAAFQLATPQHPPVTSGAVEAAAAPDGTAYFLPANDGGTQMLATTAGVAVELTLQVLEPNLKQLWPVAIVA